MFHPASDPLLSLPACCWGWCTEEKSEALGRPSLSSAVCTEAKKKKKKVVEGLLGRGRKAEPRRRGRDRE